MSRTGLALLLSALPAPALAQTVDITFDPAAKQALSNELGLVETELETLLTNQLRALYGLVDTKEFLRLSANAQSFSNKGLGAHYGSVIDGFIFGVGVNVAASAGDTDLTLIPKGNKVEVIVERAVPVAGGAQISLMAGVDLAGVGVPGLAFFVNGLYYPLSTHQLDGTFTNLGAHVQYTVLGPAGEPVALEWGGFRLTTGLELSRAQYELTESFETSTQLAESVEFKTLSTGTLVLDQSAYTIPFEATASLTVAYFVTVFAGGGVDIPLGSSEMRFDLTSDLSAKVGSEDLHVGQAKVQVTDSASADRLVARALVGVEANVGPVHGFGQVNLALKDLTVAVAAGLRFAF
ncbi:MAG: hypothetical protein HY791_18285 [Deltaproteobacteria bacterium]|nr:hypothetical protein [Deltaproteobacteria bacterium]